MKAILLALLFCTGCTRTEIQFGTLTIKRSSWGQKHVIPKVVVRADGSAEMEGYANDGGNQMIGTVVSAAVEAAIKGAKP